MVTATDTIYRERGTMTILLMIYCGIYGENTHTHHFATRIKYCASAPDAFAATVTIAAVFEAFNYANDMSNCDAGPL